MFPISITRPTLLCGHFPGCDAQRVRFWQKSRHHSPQLRGVIRESSTTRARAFLLITNLTHDASDLGKLPNGSSPGGVDHHRKIITTWQPTPNLTRRASHHSPTQKAPTFAGANLDSKYYLRFPRGLLPEALPFGAADSLLAGSGFSRSDRVWCAGLAKIIRPAAVCKALVTTTCSGWFM